LASVRERRNLRSEGLRARVLLACEQRGTALMETDGTDERGCGSDPARVQRLPLVISLTALVVAVFGATPAATAAREALQLARNSVGPQHIRAGAVQPRHLAAGAVTAPKIRAGAVTGEKIALGTLRARHFRAGEMVQGAPGPPGPEGPQGARGPQGPPGPTAGAAAGTTMAGLTTTTPIGYTAEVTTTLPGKLFVVGQVNGFVRCGQQACSTTLILTVDGRQVPTTGATFFAAAGQTGRGEFVRFGVITVPSGKHIVSWAVSSRGTVEQISVVRHGSTVGAIALGGG
jgi:hypothetical protein